MPMIPNNGGNVIQFPKPSREPAQVPDYTEPEPFVSFKNKHPKLTIFIGGVVGLTVIATTLFALYQSLWLIGYAFETYVWNAFHLLPYCLQGLMTSLAIYAVGSGVWLLCNIVSEGVIPAANNLGCRIIDRLEKSKH